MGARPAGTRGLWVLLAAAAVPAACGAASPPCSCFDRCADAQLPNYEANAAQGLCHRLYYEELPWAAAGAACAADGGILANFVSEGTRSLLTDKYSSIVGNAWVGAGLNGSSWVWNDRAQSSVDSSLWGVVPETGGENACAFTSPVADELKLFEFACGSSMSFLCTKPLTEFEAASHLLSVAAAAGSAAADITVGGTGITEALRFYLHVGGCALVAGGLPARVGADGAARWAVPAPLALATDYTLCWGISGGDRFLDTGIAVRVAAEPALRAAAFVVPLSARGSSVAVSGEWLTGDLWIAPFDTPDCSGSPVASATLLSVETVSFAGATTSASYTIPLDLAAANSARRLCIAMSRSSPEATGYVATPVTLLLLPAPTLDEVLLAVTYAQAVATSASRVVTLAGSHLAQGNWSLAFFLRGGCVGDPAATVDMRGCGAAACSFALPPAVPLGQLLHLCVQSTDALLPSPAQILVTPAPVLSTSPTHYDVSRAAGDTNEAAVRLSARNLETRGQADPMLYAWLVPSARFATEGCDSSAGVAGLLTDLSAVQGSVVLPAGLSGGFSVCIVSGLAVPTFGGDWVAAFPTSVSVYVWPEPEFAGGEVVVGCAAGDDARLVEFEGSHLYGADLYLSFARAGDGASCGLGGVVVGPQVTNSTQAALAVSFLLSAAGVDSEPSTVRLCYATSVANLSASSVSLTSASWSFTNLFFTLLPQPQPDIPADPTNILLTSREAVDGGNLLSFTGRYIQEDALWLALVPQTGSSAGSLELLLDEPCIPLSVSCAATENDQSWCESYTAVLPVLPGASYSMFWAVRSSPPATVAEDFAWSGFDVAVLPSPVFDPDSVAASALQYHRGFTIEFTGTNIGAGVWLAFQPVPSGVETSSVACDQSFDQGVFALSGVKDARASQLEVEGESSKLPRSLLTDEQQYAVCFTSVEGGAGGGFVHTGVVFKVSGDPSLGPAHFDLELPDVWDAAGSFSVPLPGENLDQAGIWAQLCDPSCGSCHAPTTEVAGGKLVFPKLRLEADFNATVCWVLSADVPGSTMSGLQPSHVSAFYPGLPPIEEGETVYPLLSTVVQLTASQDLPSDTWACLCDNNWVPVDSVARSFTPSVTSPGELSQVCMTFSRSSPVQSDAFYYATEFRVSWALPPVVHREAASPVVGLSALVAGSPTVRLAGEYLAPSVWVSVVPVAADRPDCKAFDASNEASLLSGDSSGAVFVMEGIGMDSYYLAYDVCWAPADPETGGPVWSEGGDLDVVVTVQPLPQFADEGVEIGASSVFGDDVVSFSLNGVNLAPGFAVAVHEGENGDCSGRALAADVSLVFGTTETSVAASVPSFAFRSESSSPAPFHVCWRADESDEESTAPSFPTNVVLTVLGVPSIDPSTSTISARSIMEGQPSVLLQGSSLNPLDTGIWVDCDLSSSPVLLSGTASFDVPLAAALRFAEVSICVAVVGRTASGEPTGSNVTQLRRVDGWSLAVEGHPVVTAGRSTAAPGAAVGVAGVNLRPSNVTTGADFRWAPAELAADAACRSVSGGGLLEDVADGVQVTVPHDAAGASLRLCVGLRGGQAEAEPAYVPTEFFVDVTTASAGCPSFSSIGQAVSTECYDRVLTPCIASAGTPDAVRQCSSDYTSCHAALELEHRFTEACLLEVDDATASLIASMNALDITEYHAVPFTAAIASAARVPPGFVTVEAVWPGSTHVRFTVKGGAAVEDALLLAPAATRQAFAALGEGWRDVVIERAAEPPAGGGDTNSVVLIAVGAGALAVCLLVLVVNRRRCGGRKNPSGPTTAGDEEEAKSSGSEQTADGGAAEEHRQPAKSEADCNSPATTDTEASFDATRSPLVAARPHPQHPQAQAYGTPHHQYPPTALQFNPTPATHPGLPQATPQSSQYYGRAAASPQSAALGRAPVHTSRTTMTSSMATPTESTEIVSDEISDDYEEVDPEDVQFAWSDRGRRIRGIVCEPDCLDDDAGRAQRKQWMASPDQPRRPYGRRGSPPGSRSSCGSGDYSQSVVTDSSASVAPPRQPARQPYSGNPLPPRHTEYRREEVIVETLCRTCGTTWEGGRYCGYCGTSTIVDDDGFGTPIAP
ncbi:hypothetical protein DIPPA_28761 [Diplonema papillatum]|nr:hypothetical protein DIPPA_28761 [Diplonema papillatum]